LGHLTLKMTDLDIIIQDELDYITEFLDLDDYTLNQAKKLSESSPDKKIYISLYAIGLSPNVFF